MQTEPAEGALWQRESIRECRGAGRPDLVHLEAQIHQLAAADQRPREMFGTLVPYLHMYLYMCICICM